MRQRQEIRGIGLFLHQHAQLKVKKMRPGALGGPQNIVSDAGFIFITSSGASVG